MNVRLLVFAAVAACFAASPAYAGAPPITPNGATASHPIVRPSAKPAAKQRCKHKPCKKTFRAAPSHP